jgi:hypothetical protein
MVINRLKKYGKKSNELIETLNFILKRTYW